MYCTWREHDGMRYLYADYRGCDDAQGVEVLAESAALVTAAGEPVRMLSDLTGARLGNRSMSESKRQTRDVFEPYRTRAALVGMTAFQLMSFNAFRRLGQGRAFAGFRTVEEGLEYLAGDHIVRPR